MNLDDDAVVSAPSAEKAAVPEERGPFLPFPESARPSVEHLIIEDDQPMENIYAEKQARLLTEPLYSSWSGPGENRPFAVFAEVGLFVEPKQTPLAPDVMLSLDVRVAEDLTKKENRSYFVWQFSKPPDVVVEFVSDRYGGEETHKLRDYARFGVAYYVIYDPENRLGRGVLRTFRLQGRSYAPIDPAWFADIGLGLRLWEGEYEGHHASWLRWCDQEGEVIHTGHERAEQEHERAKQEHERAEQEHERAEQEHERAEQERERAEQERERAEEAQRQASEAREKAARFAAHLQALGIDPSSLEGA